MKLSIITTITNPEERQDPYLESIASYLDIADEVVVVNGGRPTRMEDFQTKTKIINLPWPEKWNWKELPIHLNAGLEAATGDWVIKMDIDQMFHENDIAEIRRRLSEIDKPCATFQKMSVLPHDTFLQKGEVVLAINKKVNSKSICFGVDSSEYTDLCRPIYHTSTQNEVPYGKVVSFEECGRTGISIWNFDYTFKTQEVTKKEFLKFSLAYEKFFGMTKWGHTEDQAFEVFMEMMQTRYRQAVYKITDDSVIPKYIRKKYNELNDKQFGHSGWGLL